KTDDGTYALTIACHDFVNAYLAGAPSAAKIVAAIMAAIPPVAVSPPPPPSPNGAPTANFSVTFGSRTLAAPFNVTASPITGEAQVLFTDTSTDPEHDPIGGWTWTVNTQSASLCSGTPTCLWGFKPG